MTGPLTGIRVLELAQFAAGPAVGLLLADMGAEIIKIEPPDGDPTRTRSLYEVRGQSAYFMHFNRGKRSVVIDLKTAAGREVLRDLVKGADVFLSNLRPGKLEKLALDYASLRQINARIIATTVTGFGWTGEQRDRPSFDALAQAMGGLMSITGEPDRAPVVAGVTIGDLSGAMFAAMGTLGALVERGVTGAGQHVDVSMLDSVEWLAGYPGAYYLASGQVPGPLGSGHENASPYGAYQTRDGRYLFVAAHHMWEPFCRELGREDLIADARFKERKGRIANRAELDHAIQSEFRKRDLQEWTRLLEAKDIPCAPVNTLAEVFNDPLTLARRMKVEARHPDGGTYPAVGNPMKFSLHPDDFNPAPYLGADTESTLMGMAGYTRERVDELKRKGVVAGAR